MTPRRAVHADARCYHRSISEPTVDPITIALAVALVPVVGVGAAFWSRRKGAAKVRSRPRELAAAGAPLGLTPVPGLQAYASFALKGAIFPWAQAVAAVRGTSPSGEVSVIDLGLGKTGGGGPSHLETVAVFHGAHGLPRMVIQPRGCERTAEVALRTLRFKEVHTETAHDDETYFSLSYTVQAQDEAAARARFTRAAIAAFIKLEDACVTPCLDVLPDRIAFCWASKAVEQADLEAFLDEGRRLIEALRGK